MNSVLSYAIAGLSQLCGNKVSEGKVRSLALVRQAVTKVGLPWTEVKSGLWCVFPPEKHGFPVQVEIMACEEIVACVASAGIVMDRGWITRDLAMALLEENPRFIFGKVQLNENGDSVSLVMTHFLDSRTTTASHIARVSQMLAIQMQEMLVRLYARDLILRPEFSR